MPVILPFRNSVSPYRFGVTLRNTEYVFDRVRWNTRESAWHFDLREVNLTPIAFGLKIVLGAYIARRVNHILFNDGVLVVRIPQGADRREPQYDDLGVRAQAWYFTRDEMVSEIYGSIAEGG